MKRYFNNMSMQEVILVECSANSQLDGQDLSAILGSNAEIVEVTKGEYIRVKRFYESQHMFNMNILISR